MKYYWPLIWIMPGLLSCTEVTDGKVSRSPHAASGTMPAGPPVDKNRTNSKTLACTFTGYNDDGDYTQLSCRNGEDHYYFINDRNEDRSLLRGDQIRVQWKEDTIYIAGDGERPELAKWVMAVRKIKDGAVSLFREKYKKELTYWWAGNDEYSDDYKKKLYRMVEYYLAGAENKLLQLATEGNEDIGFSIEEQEREQRQYTVLGLSVSPGNHSAGPIQWLYYDREQEQLYAYDLPNDRLVLFDPGY
ncbi:hypothetical protein LL912_06260 [Niabella sp. CC-SYL272]|uniref:hypothetical protein n=1 Tax=Niabella agricola TaxID=2891571 RepID=UPI001F306729|nr:hypothetical protein [Niabella agricola]MCF3108373.1 hypothetical protein [Niabella agricola]